MKVAIDQAGWGWVALALLLLGIAGLVAVCRQAGPWRGHSWRWRLAGIILPMLAAVFVSLALGGVSLRVQREAPVVLLLDFSASTRAGPGYAGAAWRDPAWVRRLAQSHLAAGQKVSVVAFGAGEKMLLENTDPADAAAWPAAWPKESLEALDAASARAEQTDVAAALEWRTPVEKQIGRRQSARWIISDGLFAQPAAGDFPRAWTLLPPPRMDVSVRDLAVRNGGTSDQGAQVEVLAQIRVTAWATGWRNSSGSHETGTISVLMDVLRDESLIARQSLDFHAAGADPNGGTPPLDMARWISVHDTLTLEAQKLPHRYEVRAHLVNGSDQGDPWPENDRGSLVWTPPEPLRLLVIGERERLNDFQQDGIATAFVPTDQFFGDGRTLATQGWQAVLLDELPADQDAGGSGSPWHPLSAAAAAGLDQFVRQTGGGLLILGNGHAFGPGRYGEGTVAGDLLETLSPVWSRPHQGEALHVIFLLDASASMNEAADAGGTQRKFRVLAQGVRQAVELLSPQDRLSVITFNDHSHVLASGPVEKTAAGLSAMLAGVTPAGATVPDSALDAVAAALSAHPVNEGRRNLLILVTDGEIPAMDVARWKAILAPPAPAGAPLQFCIIAPPASSADAPLKQLIENVPAAIWIKTSDASAWSAALRNSVAQQVRGKIESTPLAWEFHAAGPPEENLSGITNSWTHVWLKPEAVPLVAGKPNNAAPNIEYPLAAIAQRGLGKVAAITLSDNNSQAYRMLRKQVLQQIAASSGDRRFHITVRRDQGDWQIAVDGATDQSFLNGQQLFFHPISSASEPLLDLPLLQSGPGHYEARSSTPGPFAGVIIRKTAAIPPAEQLVARVQTADIQTAEWPASIDHPFSPKDEVLLPASQEDTAVWRPLAEQSLSLSPALWLSAILCALAALGLRH